MSGVSLREKEFAGERPVVCLSGPRPWTSEAFANLVFTSEFPGTYCGQRKLASWRMENKKGDLLWSL